MYQNYARGFYGGDGHYSPPNPYSSSSSHPPTPQATPPSHQPTPPSSTAHSSNVTSQMDETAALALLQHLDKDELQHLLDNDAKLQDLISDLSQMRQVQQDHDNLVVTNKSLAEYNLSLQPRIEDLIQTVGRGYEKVNDAKTALGEHKATLDTYVGRQSLDTLHALMQTETAKSEEESEGLAERFCSQEVDADEFLSQYLPKRTVAHLRRIKAERLADMVRSGPVAGGGQWGGPPSSVPPHAQGAPSASSQWGGLPSSVSPHPQGATVTSHHRPPYPDTNNVPPYPTSAFGMPQPNMYSS